MKRKEGESFEDYKDRRKRENVKLKRYLKGRLIWDSQKYGTYVRPK